MIVAIGLHVEELILEIGQGHGDADGIVEIECVKVGVGEHQERRAPRQRSVASRIVDFPLSPAPTRQLTPSPGSQRSRLIARKFSISSTRINATLPAPASKVYWENQVTHMVNQVDCVLSSLLLVDAPTFDPSILAHLREDGGAGS